MPNSDSQDGVHNKITKDIYFVKALVGDGAIVEPHEKLAQSFSNNVDTAKAYFLTDNAFIFPKHHPALMTWHLEL